MRTTSLLLSIGAAIALAACSQPSGTGAQTASAPASLAQVQERIDKESAAAHADELIAAPGVWEGIEVPGTAASAKAVGFTDCEPWGTKEIWCGSANPVTWLGATARTAEIHLSAKNPYSPYVTDEAPDLAGKKLEDLAFNSIDVTFGHGQIGTFRDGLLRAGWLRSPDIPAAYVRRDVPLIVTMSNNSRTYFVSVRYFPLDQANAAAAKAEALQGAANSARDLADQMKD